MNVLETIEKAQRVDESHFLCLINRDKSMYAKITRFPTNDKVWDLKRLQFKRISIQSNRATIFVHILKTIQNLLIQNQICTKRDLFYQNVNLYKSQAVVDQAVEDLACSFGLGRDQLNIVASGKGLVKGPVVLHLNDGSIIDCSSQPILIPPPNMVIHF
jgi:meiotic recombination protein SPO11